MSDEDESKILGMLTHLTAEVTAVRGDVALLGAKFDHLDARVKLLAALTNSVEIRVDRVHADMHDVKMHLTGLDASVASLAATFHAQNSRTDRLDVHLALVEKRLELRDSGIG